MANAVDLALLLAMDCSSSMDDGDYRLEMQGTAEALQRPAIAAALAAGASGRIALALVQWSARDSQDIVLPWRVIASADDLRAAADVISALPRRWKPGGTGLARAIAFSAHYLAAAPLAARHVIDVSGDGEDNEADDPAGARDAAIAAGITINGLPILTGSRRIEAYYRARVIGGAGHFLVPAANTAAFGDAMALKLMREIGGVAV